MNKSYANYLLLKTEHDYNRMSEHFSNKRSYISKDLADLSKYAKSGDFVLDLGCGNGRLSELFDNTIEYCGIDPSEELIKIAREKYLRAKFAVGSGLNIPFKDQFFDVIYCLAVLHHIPSYALRKKFLSEAYRVLKPGGTMVLTVWNLVDKPEVRYLIYKEMVQKILGFSRLDYYDVFYPYKNSSGEILANRYLHCFKLKELSKLAESAGFQIIQSGKNQRGERVVNENLFLILKKLD